jgi:hypothetical protein
MAFGVRLLSVLGLTATIAGGCDRTPTAPEMYYVAELLAISNPSARLDSRLSNNTLPALFRESIAKVESRQGRQAVQVMLSDWRALQERLKTEAPTAPRAVVQSRLAAIHDAELAIVERVLGSPAITRVITESSVALSDANAEIAAAASKGEDMAAARSVATDAGDKLEAARRALSASEPRTALETASQAATLIAGLRYYLVEARRIHGIETLFPEAVAKLSGPGSQDAGVAALERLNAQTRAAVAAGDRARSHSLLSQARAAQIRIVLRAFGSTPATRLLAQVDERARAIAARMGTAPNPDVYSLKVQRMLHEPRPPEQSGRSLTEALAPLAAGRSLRAHAPQRVADAFLATRLSGFPRQTYGQGLEGADTRSIVERAFPG